MKQYPHPRAFTRVPVHLAVDVVWEGGRRHFECTRDLCMKGVYVMDPETLPEGTSCEVTLWLGEGEVRLTLAGKVVRSEAQGMAIEFLEMPVESYEHLQRLVLYNSNDVAQVERELKEHCGIREIPDLDETPVGDA
ncbi:MAG TPA: PilZ domain-containing protein [Acidobacteria bacterium]|nr:PilZ domain-containing protein [Acidobacteriota bacterium]